MAMVRELVRQGRRGLHLVGSAHSIDVDVLVAVGAVWWRHRSTRTRPLPIRGTMHVARRTHARDMLRTLVEACDFITDMGHRTPLGTRAELGYTGGGPQWLVTELGVFDFPQGRARLVQVFPDVSVDEIRVATGFPLDVAGDLRAVTPPSAAELAVVRSVDSLGVRKSEFSPRDLARVFTHDSGQDCAC
jgi:hypothetical protein